MGATASRTDDFPDTDSDPHPLDLLPLVTRPLSSVDPPNTISNSLSIAELKWNFGGSSVYVTGAWDSWKSKYALYRTQHNEFTAILLLPVGTFQYKFIVDGNWKHSPSLPTERDVHGNLNNLITIMARPREFDESDLSHDDLVGSPAESYDYSILPQEDHATEPPTLPRMLTSVPLDRYARPNAPTPDFVRLNHIFETNSAGAYGSDEVRTMATETRYKSKVVTTILIANKSSLSHPPNQYSTHHHHHHHQSRDAASPGAIPSHGESQSLIMDALNNV